MWAQAAMLAAQLFSSMQKKKQEEKLAKQSAIENILRQRAGQLGGDQYGIEAADFLRDQKVRSKQDVIDPMSLVKMYGAFAGGGGSDKGEPAGHGGDWDYPDMTDHDWSQAAQSRSEAVDATSSPDWEGLYPEDDPEWQRKHGGL